MLCQGIDGVAQDLVKLLDCFPGGWCPQVASALRSYAGEIHVKNNVKMAGIARNS